MKNWVKADTPSLEATQFNLVPVADETVDCGSEGDEGEQVELPHLGLYRDENIEIVRAAGLGVDDTMIPHQKTSPQEILNPILPRTTLGVEWLLQPSHDE